MSFTASGAVGGSLADTAGLAAIDVVQPLPAGWRRERIQALFDERKERDHPELSVLSVSQRLGVVPQEVANEVDRSSEDKSDYKRVMPGDLVYNKMRMWQAAVGTATSEGIVSPAYIVCAPRPGTVSRYYEFVFRTRLFIVESGRFSYGLCDDQNSLRFEDFKAIWVPVPPEAEQLEIAERMEAETNRAQAVLEAAEDFYSRFLDRRAHVVLHGLRA